MRVGDVVKYLRSFSFWEYRQFIIWAILTGVFLAISLYGKLSGANSQLIIEYLVMYIINSLIFFTLFRHYQALGLTMLIFTIFFELSVFGFYFFSATSLNV